MPYRSVWWYPNYTEYGTGLNPPRTWPTVMEQYQRPDAIRDLRHYDLPVTQSEDPLHFRYPRLLKPEYHGLFRDKPHCVARHYPGGMDLPEGKPRGFHGRQYYEDGPPQFKYQGAKVNELHYLEMPPYLPKCPSSTSAAQPRDPCRMDSGRGLNPPAYPGGTNTQFTGPLLTPSRAEVRQFRSGTAGTLGSSSYRSCDNAAKKITQDGVGFL